MSPTLYITPVFYIYMDRPQERFVRGEAAAREPRDVHAGARGRDELPAPSRS